MGDSEAPMRPKLMSICLGPPIADPWTYVQPSWAGVISFGTISGLPCF